MTQRVDANGRVTPVRICHAPLMGAVREYIAGLDEPLRSRLEAYQRRALELVPTAVEGTSYGLAALRYRGRPLIAVQATRHGYSVYPFSPEVVVRVLEAHGGLEATKGAIRATEERPLPDAAYDALVIARRDEIDAALVR